MAAHLRVLPLSRQAPTQPQPQRVEVTLGDLLPLIALAHRKNYVWLQDFLDDDVSITADLYEVLRAFRSSKPA
jgi:hypothetical protein